MNEAGHRFKNLMLRSFELLGLLLLLLPQPVFAQANFASPARIVREYALTSASAREKYPDPRNWRLLGSNDGGQNWTLLDARTNQVFRARSQRRVFHISNQTAFSTYRLLIEGASSAQLAELEFSGPWVGVTNEDEVQIVASSSKEHPLLGTAAEAFDSDPSSRWIDFGTGQNTCWLQCQYTRQYHLLVTNVSELAVVARRLAAHSPLGQRGPKVLASFTNPADRPARILNGYVLASANDMANRDPRDWRLLGSNDRGQTWQVLDLRRDEVFPQRFQRRTFLLTNEAPYSLYRLQIDSVRVPSGLPGGASSVQLAEIEPLYSPRDSGGNYSIVASAQGENPPLEAVEELFDGKPRTKWLDFTDDENTNRSSWVQWEYLPDGDPAVINLRWIKSLQARRRPLSVELSLQGVVVSWDPTSQRLGFVDQTGFQSFRLGAYTNAVVVGTRAHLAGQLELGRELPSISRAELSSVEPLPGPHPITVGQALSNDEDFFIGTLEAKVTSVSEDSAGWLSLGLAPENGSERMQAKVGRKPAQPRFFPGCRLRIQGVIQPLLDETGNRVAGTAWVDDTARLEFLDLSERDWSEWSLSSIARLSRTNSTVNPGEQVRIMAILLRREADCFLLTDRATNLLRVFCATSVTNLPVGSRVEAIGFLARENQTPVLRSAHLRAAPRFSSDALRQSTTPTDLSQSTTQIRKAYDRLETQPGKPFPVHLRGVITYIDLEYDSYYLQDETDGIQVLNQIDAGLAPLVRQEGSYVEVTGQMDPDYKAVVPDGFVKVLGKGRMPEARRHSWDYLVTGKDDAQWVQLEGIVSACTEAGLTLIVVGGRLAVVVNDFDQGKQERLLGSLVRINGVCQAIRDNRNRRVGLQLLVPYMDCIEVLRPAPEDPFDQTLRKIAELDDQRSRSTNLTIRLVKTAGTVTYKEPRVLFIQDGNDGMRVFLRADSPVHAGDRIEAVGLAEPDGFSPRLAQAIVRKIGTEGLPPAQPIDLMGPDVTDQDATRVRLEATLVGIKSGKMVQVLELNDIRGGKACSALVPVAAEALPAMPLGSRVEVTGVFRSESETLADLGQIPTAFQMYLNGPEDIRILLQPSWWTARHTLWVSAALASILLVALTWASSLRNQVHQRTEQLHAEIAEHKRTEEALEISERFMRSLVESLPQNIIRKDLSGRFTFANDFFCRTIGKPLDQILGKSDFDLFPADLAAKFRADDERVIASRKLFETVEESRNASGENIFVQVIKSPLLDASGMLMGIQVIFWDVTERKRAESRLEEAQKAMLDASRQAGMAEVAAGVLHNVGNVLNSVNVSASLVSDNLQRSKAPGLAKAVALLREQEADLAGFFARDPRGKQLTAYLAKLAECLAGEQASALQELQILKKNIEHIKEIVAMQQSYARIVGVTEKVKVTDLVEDALRLNSGTLARHEVELTKEYAPDLPEIIVERHKVLQILVNLIRNAKYACDESGRRDKHLIVRVAKGDGCVNISTTDNGVGIAPENLTRIFNHGFTTRKDGHGFGLHSGALAAKEMGGALLAHSDGPGKGASFTLSLPLAPSEQQHITRPSTG
ncbi:MAG TPA: PAS domain-containing protein [Verrucomicrobiae bacterium]|nr:PAS domain-containing protein [Verrucomicrobiae bacterium]